MFLSCTKPIYTLILIISLFSCSKNKTTKSNKSSTVKTTFTLAFGSCNNQNLTNSLWSEILKNKPDVWVWGGDIIYAGNQNVKLMESYFNQVKNDSNYINLKNSTEILGTWDDHDYGPNDGGKESVKKDTVQQLLLDFLEAPNNDLRRSRQGVYYSKTFPINDKSITIILLDTRYFRDSLTKDLSGNKRYIPTTDTHSTMLGNKQWKWLANELNNSTSDFNIIMSSVQFLSYEHGFESWGTMPHEVKKLEQLIISSKAKGVIILSGDRHIAEISAANLEKLSYPLYDFTSSGLTHSYKGLSSEPNVYRKSKLIKDLNFGLLKFNLETTTVTMEIRGLKDTVQKSVSVIT